MNRELRYKIRGLWDMTRDALEVERRRLESGVGENEVIQGTTVCNYFFICDGDAWEVLRGAREVIGIVNEISLGDGWPSDEDWRHILPQWFVDACAAEDEPVEDGPYPSTFEERRTRFFNEKWKVSNWVSWMEPEDRRIECGLNETDRQMGLFPDEFDFTCQGNADVVPRKARDVMAIVSDASLAGSWQAPGRQVPSGRSASLPGSLKRARRKMPNKSRRRPPGMNCRPKNARYGSMQTSGN